MCLAYSLSYSVGSEDCINSIIWLILNLQFKIPQYFEFEFQLTRPKAVTGPGGPSYAGKAWAINARKSRV
jgi:hypothetical protein